MTHKLNTLLAFCQSTIWMPVEIRYLFIFIFTALVCSYLIKSSKFAAEPGKLSYGFFIKALGALCFLIAAICLAVLVSQSYEVNKPGETKALIFLIAMFGSGAFYFLAEATKVKAAYNKNRIVFFSPWSKPKYQSWHNLTAVKFSAMASWHTLTFEDGTVIRISSYLAGRGHLFELLLDKGFAID